jgi:hypothetical protein
MKIKDAVQTGADLMPGGKPLQLESSKAFRQSNLKSSGRLSSFYMEDQLAAEVNYMQAKLYTDAPKMQIEFTQKKSVMRKKIAKELENIKSSIHSSPDANISDILKQNEVKLQEMRKGNAKNWGKADQEKWARAVDNINKCRFYLSASVRLQILTASAEQEDDKKEEKVIRFAAAKLRYTSNGLEGRFHKPKYVKAAIIQIGRNAPSPAGGGTRIINVSIDKALSGEQSMQHIEAALEARDHLLENKSDKPVEVKIFGQDGQEIKYDEMKKQIATGKGATVSSGQAAPTATVAPATIAPTATAAPIATVAPATTATATAAPAVAAAPALVAGSFYSAVATVNTGIYGLGHDDRGSASRGAQGSVYEVPGPVPGPGGSISTL